MKLAKKYACRYRGNDGSYSHTSGHGTPTRKTCARCKGPIDVQTGLWGVFTWTGTGRYPEDKAHATYASHKKAESVAETKYAVDPAANWVVRWIPKEEAR